MLILPLWYRHYNIIVLLYSIMSEENKAVNIHNTANRYEQQVRYNATK